MELYSIVPDDFLAAVFSAKSANHIAAIVISAPNKVPSMRSTVHCINYRSPCTTLSMWIWNLESHLRHDSCRGLTKSR